MKIKWYLLDAGKLQEQPAPEGDIQISLEESGERWYDVQEAETEEYINS